MKNRNCLGESIRAYGPKTSFCRATIFRKHFTLDRKPEMAKIAAILDFTQKMAELKIFHTKHVEMIRLKTLLHFVGIL